MWYKRCIYMMTHACTHACTHVRLLACSLSNGRYMHRMHQQRCSCHYNRVNCKHTQALHLLVDECLQRAFPETSVALQDAPATFWPVVTSSVTCSAITFVLIYGYWKFWPNRRHRRRVKDMAAIRDLLVHHMDDLDDIMDKLHLHSGDLTCASWFRVQGLGLG